MKNGLKTLGKILAIPTAIALSGCDPQDPGTRENYFEKNYYVLDENGEDWIIDLDKDGQIDGTGGMPYGVMMFAPESKSMLLKMGYLYVASKPMSQKEVENAQELFDSKREFDYQLIREKFEHSKEASK